MDGCGPAPAANLGWAHDPGTRTEHAPRIEDGERSFSFEFFPPKDAEGEEQLWRAITELEPYEPTFVSVTYGAGGTSRDTTVRITGRIARETSLVPVGHLTCVGHTREELGGRSAPWKPVAVGYPAQPRPWCLRPAALGPRRSGCR